MVSRVSFLLAAGVVALGSATAGAQRNNPFSTNPEARTTPTNSRVVPSTPSSTRQPVAQPIKEAVSTTSPSDLTAIYRVGPGDVIYIALANAANASGYYGVRPDGSIDFPLAGGDPRVAGLTPSEIAKTLSAQIKIFKDPKIVVKVSEFSSHRIAVTGMVESRGDRFLPREAMPLFTIKAVVGVRSSANRVLIKRAGMSVPEVYNLSDDATDNILVYPGSEIEFRTDELSSVSPLPRRQ